MDFKLIFFGLLFAAFVISMASIGLKFHGKIPDDKKAELGNNKTYLVVILVLGCLLALGMLYMGTRSAQKAGIIKFPPRPTKF